MALYALALIGGALLGVVAAGDLALDLAHRERPSRLQRVAAAGLAALIVAALVMIPVLGPVVLLVLTAVGIGAMGVSLWRGGERRGAVPVAPEPAPA